MDMIQHEIVPVHGKYYSVMSVRKNGTVVLEHLPTHRFANWEKRGGDLRKFLSLKHALAIPKKRQEVEELWDDLRQFFLRKVDEIIAR